jgi:hypothetical protein
MNQIFENPFTWLFIGLTVALTFHAIGTGKKNVAKETTNQMQIQFRMDSLRAVQK